MTGWCTPVVAEGRAWAVAEDPDEALRVLGLGGQPQGAAWEPVTLRLLTEDDRGRPVEPTDLPWHTSSVLVLGPRAQAALGDLLAPAGELLPVRGATDHVLFSPVVLVADALDDSSDVVRFGSSGRIMDLRRPVLRAAALHGRSVVKLADMPRGPLFVSSAVVDAAERAGLVGPEWQAVPLV